MNSQDYDHPDNRILGAILMYGGTLTLMLLLWMYHPYLIALARVGLGWLGELPALVRNLIN